MVLLRVSCSFATTQYYNYTEKINCSLKFTAGIDYGSVTQELTFTASSVLTQCVNITIIQDSAVENSVEIFSVQAVTSSSIITGLPTSRTIIIQEDMDRKSQHTQYLQTSL